MSVLYYINGQKVSKKTLTGLIGAEIVRAYTNDAWMLKYEDPYIQADYWIGSMMLTIMFKI